MLLLAIIFCVTIALIIAREAWSQTYRCPYCAKIEIGELHRRRCFLVSRDLKNARRVAELQAAAARLAVNQGTIAIHFGVRRRKRLVPSVRAVLGPRAAMKAVAAVWSRHLHIASPSA